jgi:hypothetical protein
MKKLFKIGWLVLVIGLVALGIGYFNGGNKTIAFNNHNQPTVVKSHVRHLSSGKRFDRLDLSASTADVVIKQGDKYQVTYYGMGGKIPTARLNGRKMTVRQTGHISVHLVLNDYNDRDQIVVTVPKGHALAGRINVHEGSLTVSKVNLTNCTVDVRDGDVVYKQAALNGGRTTLTEGDFTGRQLTVNGHYTVANTEGDNTVTDTTADGYHLHTSDGDNKLDGQKHEQTWNQNNTATNVLSLVNSDGDNEVK